MLRRSASGLAIGGGPNMSFGPGAVPELGTGSPTPGVTALSVGCDGLAPGAVEPRVASIRARESGATRRTSVLEWR